MQRKRFSVSKGLLQGLAGEAGRYLDALALRAARASEAPRVALPFCYTRQQY
jgi:hypothetical protein